jgi:quinone-modifying oxidoreductase subunit QmoC
MAETTTLEPDLSFIKEVGKLGGGDLKKCYQCATCSVACKISPDNKPFPRKEMIAASWGLKDRLVPDYDVWLCHNCGDCTTMCPRGAKPGNVMAAIRAYAIQEYATPKFLAKWVADPSKLPILFLLPAVIMVALGLLLKAAGIDWLNFTPPATGQIAHADFFSTWLVDIIFVPLSIWAVAVFALGLKRFIGDMHASAIATGKAENKEFNAGSFIQSLVRVIPTILKHDRFNECGENKDRSTAHLLVLFSFIALFIVTSCFFVALYILQIHGPYSQLNPIKWLANVGGVALIIGGWMLIQQRRKKEQETSSYFDWYLLGLVFALGVTGMGAQVTRLAEWRYVTYWTYFVHLVFVFMLFAYLPFSKLAHLVYRTVAMAYAEYTNRQ